MARIAFIGFPGYGHTLPAVSLAKTLQRRGHDVMCINTEAFRSIIETAGVSFCAFEDPKREPPRHSYANILANFTALIDATLERLPDVLRSWHADALVIDQSVITGRTIAELLGIPFVTLCTGLHVRREQWRLVPFFWGWSPARGPLKRACVRAAFFAFDAAFAPLVIHLNRKRRAFGLPSHRTIDDTMSPDACLAQLPPSLEPHDSSDARFHLLGPLIDEAVRRAIDGRFADKGAIVPDDHRPLLYFGFGLDGTTPRRLLQTALAASDDLGFLRVVTTGGLPVPVELARLHGRDTIFSQFVAQLPVLRRASLVVTHGGMNTVAEALLCGCPLLVVPLAYDQHGLGARVSWAGVGLTIRPRRASVDRVRAALIRLRDDDGIRARASAVAAATAATGGVSSAADIVERLAGSAASQMERPR